MLLFCSGWRRRIEPLSRNQVMPLIGQEAPNARRTYFSNALLRDAVVHRHAADSDSMLAHQPTNHGARQSVIGYCGRQALQLLRSKLQRIATLQ